MLGSTIYQPTHNSLDINKNSVEYVKQRSALFGFSEKPAKTRFLPNTFTLYAVTYLLTGYIISKKHFGTVLKIPLRMYIVSM